ncbi:MAG: PQQ-like beta-propeller repeat protein [Verrucomicrobiales bacterium]|nr:PQQ-like beta-propeller repeat protein [Verrucomicrobiales bacterium]
MKKILTLFILLGSHCLTHAQTQQTFERLTFHNAPKPLSKQATTSDWQRFLGPTDNGHSPETQLLTNFLDRYPSRVWEVRRGRSHTAPVIADDYLVFIHELDGKETIECLHPETGQRYWKIDYPVEISQSYGITDAPRSSPVIDPDSRLVFTLGVSSRLQAIELSTGKILWQQNLEKTLGKTPFFFGRGSCPLIYGDLLIVNAGAPGATVIAFDKKTGKTAWKTDHSWNASYSSPIIAKIHGKDRLLVFAGGMTDPPQGGLLCIDPTNGKLDDAFPWRSTMFASVNAASPVLCGSDQVFLTEGYDRGGVMIQFSTEMKMSPLWKAPRFASQFQSPIYHDGYLYGFSGSSATNSELVCYEAKTGKEQWREGFPELAITFQGRELKVLLGRGSLLHVENKFLALGAQGTLLWLDLKPDGIRMLPKSQLFHSPDTWAPPALSRGLLYVSQNGPSPKLICYDLRK